MSEQNSKITLGTEKIWKLLIEYSIPAIIAMTASSIYNIIDRIFIGQGVGPLAISGLALTLPFINLAIAFGALVGAGASAMVSIRLGEKNIKAASLILGNSVVLNIVISIIYSGLMLIFLDPFLYLFGASKETLPYAREFMQIILIGNVFMHSYIGLNNLIRASGYPIKAMIITILTVLINLILAPIFIFIFKWGIRGAATATIIAQFLGLIITVLHFFNKNNYIHFLPGYFRIKRHIIADIFSIGMPTFILNICACLITIIMNLMLVKHGGDYAVGAFGIINSILTCIIMIIIGLNQGMQPIVGFNYGAGRLDRSKKAFKYTIIAATIITSFGFIAGIFGPGIIARAFTTSNELIRLTVTGMRFAVLMYPIVGFQIVTSNFFQSIGKANVSILLSLSRQILFLIPLLLIFSHLFGLIGIWIALPAADFLAAGTALFVLLTVSKKIPQIKS